MTFAQGLFEEKETAQHVLGEVAFTNDGRAFRYSKAGAVALVAGTLQQGPAEDTSDQDITPTATAAGATTVTVGSMTVTANQYAGGQMVGAVTPGIGYSYRIKSHAAFSAAAATFELEDAIQVALTTSSRLDFVMNPFNGTVINPTTLTSAPVGVAIAARTIGYFGWLQVAGNAPILSDGGDAVGSDVVASNGTAGAVEDAATSGAQPIIGTAVTGVATGNVGLYKLRGLL